jgi:hypothetical protein
LIQFSMEILIICGVFLNAPNQIIVLVTQLVNNV